MTASLSFRKKSETGAGSRAIKSPGGEGSTVYLLLNAALKSTSTLSQISKKKRKNRKRKKKNNKENKIKTHPTNAIKAKLIVNSALFLLITLIPPILLLLFFPAPPPVTSLT